MLPGRCTQAESSYYTLFMAFQLAAVRGSVFSADFGSMAPCVGFVCALNAARLALQSMTCKLQAEAMLVAQDFVQRVMDLWLFFSETESGNIVLKLEKMTACIIHKTTFGEKDAHFVSLQAEWNSEPFLKMRERRDLLDISAIQARFAIAEPHLARRERMAAATTGSEGAAPFDQPKCCALPSCRKCACILHRALQISSTDAWYCRRVVLAACLSLLKMSHCVILLRGPREAALEGAQADVPRDNGCDNAVLNGEYEQQG